LPSLGLVVQPPAGEAFSELYILGPNHTLDDIPFNVKSGATYLLYLGVGNHLGSSSYYRCSVKVRNETGPLPDTVLGIPSPLPTLYEYKFFLRDETYWETPLTFTVNELTLINGVSYLSSVTINGKEVQVNQYSAWNSNKTGYYYGLFVELWNFNADSNALQFHNRTVHLILNMTK
jgi:uncharacterized membrane protein